MEEVFEKISEVAEGWYLSIIEAMPAQMALVVQVFILSLIIALVAFFIWNFYKSLAQKSLINLDLSKYNRTADATANKTLAILLNLLLYLIIVPIVISAWFIALSVFILLVAQGIGAEHILMISASMIIATRILAYYKKEIAQELAKLFPFITLSMFLLTPVAFDASSVISRIAEIPALLGSVFNYIFAIFVVEILLRIFLSLNLFFVSEEQKGLNNKTKK